MDKARAKCNGVEPMRPTGTALWFKFAMLGSNDSCCLHGSLRILKILQKKKKKLSIKKDFIIQLAFSSDFDRNV